MTLVIDPRDAPPSNVTGDSISITLFTTQKWWGGLYMGRLLLPLPRYFRRLMLGAMDDLSFISFASWTIVREIPDDGPGQSVTKLELDDIQGDILRAYGNAYDCTAYVFVEVPDAGRGQAWLSTLAPRVRTASLWAEGKPDCHTNVAVTAAGLRALGVSDRLIATFAPEFLDGMAARAGLLGDVGPSAPGHWHADFSQAHVLVTLNTREPEQMGAETNDLRADLDAHGLRVVHEQQAALLRNAREHFGFADGFAQPAIAGAADHRSPGGGIPKKGGGWRSLAAGEFILGYHDEDTTADPKRGLPPAPAAPLGRNGTYMVWRKLYQDVALFRRTLRAAAARYPAGDEMALAAKVVGRWPNGTPLVTSPDAPDPGFDPLAEGANDFRYGDDPHGRRCPLGAHIRRSNPRDSLDPAGHQTFRHRMIRRGMPYGPRLPEGVLDDDGTDRGLCFVSFQASITRQFEGVQVPWLNDGNIFRLGHDTDFLLGDVSGRGGKMTIPARSRSSSAPRRPS